MKNAPVFLLLMAVALNGLPGTDLLVLCLGSDGHLDVHDLSTHETEEGCCEHETGCSSEDCDCLHAPLPGSNDILLSCFSFTNALERRILAQGDAIPQPLLWIPQVLSETYATGPPPERFLHLSLSTIVLII